VVVRSLNEGRGMGEFAVVPEYFPVFREVEREREAWDVAICSSSRCCSS